MGNVDTKLEEIADGLLSFMPFVHKRLLRTKQGCNKQGFTPGIGILGVIMKCGPMPVSDVGRRLCISKPNMTFLTDRLIEHGFIERVPDKDDRRTINLAITRKGKKYVKETKNLVKEDIKRNLSSLEDEDIKELHDSIEKIKKIFSKLNKEEEE